MGFVKELNGKGRIIDKERWNHGATICTSTTTPMD